MFSLNCHFRALIQFMMAPKESLSTRTYNVYAMSFTPEEIFEEVKKWVPELTIEYQPDARQQIAETWPLVFDDSLARAEWGWESRIPVEKLVEIMITNLRRVYNK